ncbi:hypothetical protein [Amycolatopsis anabasis]|uniref:hypothetical protein n=1 Tax=Amycolatopsis anabasis TaxID=1840409 RepID=UPI00131D6621|nr:hypothetical protein [Amycolatopsis anabasis]
MSFFDADPVERSLPEPDRELYAYADGSDFGPTGDHFVPALLPWRVELARADRVLVRLQGVRVWPAAVTLVLTVHSRDDLPRPPGISLFDRRRPAEPGDFRIGVLFADGARAAVTGHLTSGPARPEQPRLVVIGGTGGQFHTQHDLRLRPLPPEGPLTVVTQWPARGVPETRTELDGTAIRAAAAEALELWPDLPRRPT